jgi:hypothetical protein
MVCMEKVKCCLFLFLGIFLIFVYVFSIPSFSNFIICQHACKQRKYSVIWKMFSHVHNGNLDTIVAKGGRCQKNGLCKLKVCYVKSYIACGSVCSRGRPMNWWCMPFVKPCFGIGVWHTCIINIFTHWMSIIWQHAYQDWPKQ